MKEHQMTEQQHQQNMKNVIQRCKTELLKRFRFFPVLFSVPFIPVR